MEAEVRTRPVYLVIVRSPLVIEVKLVGQVGDAMRSRHSRPHLGQAPALFQSHPPAGHGFHVLRPTSVSPPSHPSCPAEEAVRRGPLPATGTMQSHFTGGGGGNTERREGEAGHLGAQGCWKGCSPRREGGPAPTSLSATASGIPGRKGPLGGRGSELTTNLTLQGRGWALELGEGPVGEPGPDPTSLDDWFSAKRKCPIRGKRWQLAPLHHQPMSSKFLARLQSGKIPESCEKFGRYLG